MVVLGCYRVACGGSLVNERVGVSSGNCVLGFSPKFKAVVKSVTCSGSGPNSMVED